MRQMIAVSALALLVSGCALFTPPSQKPVIEEKLNRGFIDDTSAVGTLSLTPERRVVLVSFKNERFCAEAPTEVGADVSRLLQATASLKDPRQIEAGISALVATTLSNSVLNKRSQGIQLFQSSSYFLCQMYMNEAINAEQLIRLQLEALNIASQLVNKEIPLLYSQADDATRTGITPLDINQLMKDLQASANPKQISPQPDPQESPDVPGKP